jgi:hypothetical protein
MQIGDKVTLLVAVGRYSAGTEGVVTKVENDGGQQFINVNFKTADCRDDGMLLALNAANFKLGGHCP